MAGQQAPDNEEGYFYVPEVFDDYPRDMLMDEDSGDLTWGDVCDALTILHDEHGHSGPFDNEQFYNACVQAVVDPSVKSLVDKGFLEAVLQRNGEMGYQLTELGREAAKYMMEE